MNFNNVDTDTNRLNRPKISVCFDIVRLIYSQNHPNDEDADPVSSRVVITLAPKNIGLVTSLNPSRILFK